MGILGANNFLISRDNLCFLVHKWSPDFRLYKEIAWLESYSEINHFIECCYCNQTVPRKTHVTFDIQLSDEIFVITENPLSQYPEYDYKFWSYNGKYMYGSKDWKRIMGFHVLFRRLSHEVG